ncbi:hypothetical protein MHYP_G00239030 [Metynnis hypsauchen]
MAEKGQGLSVQGPLQCQGEDQDGEGGQSEWSSAGSRIEVSDRRFMRLAFDQLSVLMQHTTSLSENGGKHDRLFDVG